MTNANTPWPLIVPLPPAGEENRQPIFANLVEVSGGGPDPLLVDFYYLSLNAYRRVMNDPSAADIERPSDDRVIFRTPPVAALCLAPTAAVDLIVAMYSRIEGERLIEHLDRRIEEIRQTRSPSTPTVNGE